jgi:hypothetical protein
MNTGYVLGSVGCPGLAKPMPFTPPLTTAGGDQGLELAVIDGDAKTRVGVLRTRFHDLETRDHIEGQRFVEALDNVIACYLRPNEKPGHRRSLRA